MNLNFEPMAACKEPLKVLDLGYVLYVGHMGSDETIVEAARMSTGKGFLGWEPRHCCVLCGLTPQQAEGFVDSDKTDWSKCRHRFADTKGDASLLEFLYRNKHMTPFEMCELAVEVKAPIFIFREWHRHRTFSYNEFSARYAQMPNEHYLPEADRFKPVYSQNKQESSKQEHVQHALDLSGDGLRESLAREQTAVYGLYETMVSGGVPKEVARINTPVSRYSRMRAKTDLRNWLQFLTLRDHPAAQWEIQQYAKAVAQIVQALWPRTYALYEEYTKYAVTLSRSEAKAFEIEAKVAALREGKK